MPPVTRRSAPGTNDFSPLLHLDLDRFKLINDAVGHDAGDEVLKIVVERIQQRVRESDTVARIGGDEFTVVLPRIADRLDAGTVAGKIIDALPSSSYSSRRKQEVRLGASIGIAIFPGDAEDPVALVRAADAAMYAAKRTRNTFQFGKA
ncbi:MAG: GGDEF domain-containing protein [Burkholderiales bacterium]